MKLPISIGRTDTFGYVYGLQGADGVAVIGSNHGSFWLDQRDARRIVASVNVLAMFTIEAIEELAADKQRLKQLMQPW